MNRQESSALEFHEATKHSEIGMRTSAHYLDWDNKPEPFKRYPNVPSIALPRDFPRPGKPALQTLQTFASDAPTKNIDLETLAEVLFFSAGITRVFKTRAGTYFMRAAPATGALYPIELYVVCRGITGLGPGVYHFNPDDFALVKLRDGDYSAEVVAASGCTGSSWPVTIALTSLAWRNAWKYEDRSYRHWFWDGGVIAANLLATSSSEDLPVRMDLGFVDSDVDRLLGLVSGKEATVALAHLGPEDRHKGTYATKSIPRLDAIFEPLSREEVDYPLIWKTSSESALQCPTEVVAWRQKAKRQPSETQSTGSGFQLRPLEQAPQQSLEETILRRGSTRRFAPQPISFEHLSTIIDSATTEVPTDFLMPGESLIQFYLIVNQVQGLPSGSYFFEKDANSLLQLRAGRFRDMAGYLCLGQSLFSDASAVFFLMTDLGQVLESLENRGYRAAEFEAGIRAERIYLSAYALGNGASGSTFFDDAVTEFFSPHAKDRNTMIAVGVGVPGYKARPGRVLAQFRRQPG